MRNNLPDRCDSDGAKNAKITNCYKEIIAAFENAQFCTMLGAVIVKGVSTSRSISSI